MNALMETAAEAGTNAGIVALALLWPARARSGPLLYAAGDGNGDWKLVSR